MAKQQAASDKKRTRKKSPSKAQITKKSESALQQNISENIAISQNSDGYTVFANGISALLEEARHLSAKSVNAILTATYWEMGRRIIEIEQNGKIRAEYGENLLAKLSQDLLAKFGRGFGVDNLQRMRLFFFAYPTEKIYATLSRKSCPTDLPSESVDAYTLSSYLLELSQAFQLSWSHYVLLLALKKNTARSFYEAEALRGGWSVRQLDRQISSQFYERTLLSRNKAAMLQKGSKPLPQDLLTAEEEIKDPVMLEFLGLKDEYSESQLEEALIRHLETFLLELGFDFAFVGRQRRLRIGETWYRVDLLFFHRLLRCLVIVDLKIGKFNHADVGQMHLYLNYAKEHWTHPHENPPVGLILCAQKDEAVAHYALTGLSNKVLTAEYQTELPDEKILVAELERTQKMLETRIRVPRQRAIKKS